MLARFLDSILEMTVVPGFSRLGPPIRRRLYGWTETETDLTECVVVVTGSSSGIGRAIATRLAAMGAQVWITSRSQETVDRVSTQVSAETGNDHVVGYAVDLGEFDAVRNFSDRLHNHTPGIDVLIHNAGGLNGKRQITSTGVESTLAVHLLGPYLLTRRLEDHLRPGARILFMSSGGMYTQELDLVSLEMAGRNYKGAVAYARVKRAQVVLSSRLAEEYRGRFVVHAMHPGWAATSGLDGGLPRFSRIMTPLLRTPDQAADTMVWLATSNEATATSGDFWHDRKRRRTVYIPGTGTHSRVENELIPWTEARIRKAER